MTKLERLLACDGTFVGAHRGYSAKYPENTLLAAAEAVEMGVDLIEVDLYLTRDGVPVLAHDHELSRCSTGSGFLHDYTLRELKALDFGIHRGARFEGLMLPTLEQFLDYMKDYPDVLMDIDFKVYPYTLETVKAVLPMLEAFDVADRCIYNCIDCDIVAYLYDRCGKRTVGAPHDYPHRLHFHLGEDGTFSKLWGICIPYRMLNEEHVRLYRDHGIAIVCTPCDTPEQVAYASQFSPTLPLCDDPRAYLQYLGRTVPQA